MGETGLERLFVRRHLPSSAETVRAEAVLLQRDIALEAAYVGDSHEVRPSVRRSRIGWVHDWAERPICMELVSLMRAVNDVTWRFSLDDRVEMQLTYYDARDHGAYHAHCDQYPRMDERAHDRKVSASLMLSAPGDYHGGSLQIDKQALAPLRQGEAVIFPSTLSHCVRPLLAGARWSLVCWHGGPPWR